MLRDEFEKEFKEDISSLINESDKDQLLALKQRVVDLSQKVNEATLPSYDQQLYLDKIETVFKQISTKEQALKPARKFKFKPKEKAEPVRNVSSFTFNDTRASFEVKDEIKEVSVPYVTKVENSVLYTPPLNAANMENISNSVVIVESKGPIFIKQAKNSVLILKGHQLRLHNIVDCKIYIDSDAQQNVIIEHSTNLQFHSKSVVSVQDFNLQHNNYQFEAFELYDMDKQKLFENYVK